MSYHNAASFLGFRLDSQRSFDVLISREGKKEQRRSEPRRNWGEEIASLVVEGSP